MIEWLINSFGGTDHARRTWAVVSGFGCVCMAVGTVSAVVDRQPREPAFLPVVLGLEVIYFSGLALAFVREHPVGGRIWLFATPAACAALVIYGNSKLPSPLTGVPSGSSPTARMMDILAGFGPIVMALAILASWTIFLLYYARRHRLASWARLLAESFMVLMAITAVTLAIISGGGQSTLLTSLMVGFGAMTVARGARRLKKLANAIRVG
ncbi:hypothetical protein [Streptomyces rimosus]|uniref:hypothetical protein n=1 Tax=Streptomyces rimosus TaxID=1927 RepID=UPI0004CC0EED|nr:hypothetical protein [Streptomyces rimosus]